MITARISLRKIKFLGLKTSYRIQFNHLRWLINFDHLNRLSMTNNNRSHLLRWPRRESASQVMSNKNFECTQTKYGVKKSSIFLYSEKNDLLIKC